MKKNGRMEIIEEIKQLVDRDEIDQGVTIVLMLNSQVEILKRTSEQEKRLSDIEMRNERYPSITWLWKNERKTVIGVLIALALLYTFIFSPWLISDIRHAVLELIGLPSDLGITTP